MFFFIVMFIFYFSVIRFLSFIHSLLFTLNNALFSARIDDEDDPRGNDRGGGDSERTRSANGGSRIRGKNRSKNTGSNDRSDRMSSGATRNDRGGRLSKRGAP